MIRRRLCPSRLGQPFCFVSLCQLLTSLATWLFVAPQLGYAARIEIAPPSTFSCNEQLVNVANALKPGDELVLRGGIYSQDCYRAITVNGTAANPIIIRAATGEKPIITRSAAASQRQNNIDIANSSYVIIRGIHFRGGDGGVRFIGGHHITIEDCEISETLNNGLRLNTTNSDSYIIRRNHIHHTGLNTTRTTEGEGIYFGCHDGSCRVTNSIVENNYIHHLRSTSGGGNDGIEVKAGSAGNIIRNNVIHDTNIGTRYPCIFVYGGGAAVNVVEGNSVWNCGEGIYAVSDAVVRNNIIANSTYGFSSYPHNTVSGMKNLTVENNTIYGASSACLLMRWDTASNGVFANNAAYCPGKTAVDVTGLVRSGLTVSANYIEGAMLRGMTTDNTAFFAGGTAASAFTNPAQLNFWPTATSPLLGKANASVISPTDFNHTTRTAPFDVGAYERETALANPGWAIVAGFKGTGSPSPSQQVVEAPTNLQVQVR